MGRMLYDSTPHATHGNRANQAGSFFISMKPPRSFGEQLSLMESRGLTVEDEPSALRRLAESNYYRLRGCWLTFEEDGRFIPGTTFDDIWETYQFDGDV